MWGSVLASFTTFLFVSTAYCSENLEYRPETGDSVQSHNPVVLLTTQEQRVQPKREKGQEMTCADASLPCPMRSEQTQENENKKRTFDLGKAFRAAYGLDIDDLPQECEISFTTPSNLLQTVEHVVSQESEEKNFQRRLGLVWRQKETRPITKKQSNLFCIMELDKETRSLSKEK